MTMSPSNPRFWVHTASANIVRWRSVYRQVAAEEIQQQIQYLIAAMAADGYPSEVIRAVLTQAADLAVHQASTLMPRFLPRARFFQSLIFLELEQL